MDLASILRVTLAPASERSAALEAGRERARAWREGEDPVLVALSSDSRLLETSARVVADIACDLGLADRDAALLHRVALLALALDQRPEILARVTRRQEDFESLGAAARGQIDDERGPLSAHVLGVRDAVASRPGWVRGADLWIGALADAVEAFVHVHRMRTVQPGSTAPMLDPRPAAGLLALTVAIAKDDPELRRTHGEIELALQLSAVVVSLRRSLAEHADRPDRDGAANEIVARRFALPTQVILLGPPEVERCLCALVELEARDLADALVHLRAEGVLADALARATLVLAGLAGELPRGAATVPDRDGVMAELRAVARLDGAISSDERALLRGADTQLHAFSELVRRVEEDSVTDFDEFRQLRAARQAMLDELLRIALADDVIQHDERELLVRALELLPSLR